jgi:hypothetical protein
VTGKDEGKQRPRPDPEKVAPLTDAIENQLAPFRELGRSLDKQTRQAAAEAAELLTRTDRLQAHPKDSRDDMRRLIENVESLHAEQVGADNRRTIGRPPAEVPLRNVLKAEEKLKQRARLAAPPRTGPLTYSAIAKQVGLNRHRVREIEELMKIGWPLSESHPDFPADEGFVKLPTPRQAARLGRLR